MTEKEFNSLKVGDVVKIKDYRELLEDHNETLNAFGEKVISLTFGFPPYVKQSACWDSRGGGKIFHIKYTDYPKRYFLLDEISSCRGYYWQFNYVDFDVMDEDDDKIIPEEDFATLF